MTTAVTGPITRKPIPSLPQWIISASRLICERTEAGEKVFYLAGNKLLESAERQEVERFIRDAESYLVPAIRDSKEGQKQALEALEKIFRVYAASEKNEGSVAARAAIYLEALGDLPGHAIQEAVSRWLRGEGGHQEYNFAPKPPILRFMALEVLNPAREMALQLRKLLAAADYRKPEPIEGERERVHAGLKQLSQELGENAQRDKEQSRQRSSAFTAETARRQFDKEWKSLGETSDKVFSPRLAALLKKHAERT